MASPPQRCLYISQHKNRVDDRSDIEFMRFACLVKSLRLGPRQTDREAEGFIFKEYGVGNWFSRTNEEALIHMSKFDC